MSLMNRLMALAAILTASYAIIIVGLGMLLQYYLGLSVWFGWGAILVGIALYVYQYQAMRR